MSAAATERALQHVGVEASRLLRERRGIGRYVRNLLLQMAQLRPAVRFTLYVRRFTDIEPLREQLAAFAPALVLRCEFDVRSRLPSTLADVVWYPWNWVKPEPNRARVVVSIHDVAPMIQFDHRWWKWLKRAKQRRRYQHAVTRADRVIAISSFTGREVQRLLHVDARKVTVVLNGADDLPHPATSEADPLASLSVDRPFFLTVGASEARKNLSVVYRAIEILQREGERVLLVQCGPNAVADGGSPNTTSVRNAGFVSDAGLAALYRRAVALVFPSRYEGFGLPVLEAMNAGGCALCADASSLPEVGGDAALYFPWDDPAALAVQMQRLLHDSAFRDALCAKGRAHAAGFRWARCASETLAVFDAAVAGRAGSNTLAPANGTERL